MAIEGIIGKKVGMTQVFAEDGALVPVTVIQAGPCLVVQKKTAEKDGYDAVQIGLVEKVSSRRVTSAMRGHFEKAGIPPVRTLCELAYSGDANIGDKVQVDIFKAGDSIDVVGQSKGKGFQGVVKRHHFRGGRATHGSMFHRAPGSIGASAFPSRVMKGMRMGGRMGGDQVTVKNRSEVSGSGKKPFRQKGTGRARQGGNRPPIHRHGGTVFGPVPRDYSYKMNAQEKKNALKSALSQRVKEGKLVVLSSLAVDEPKTKALADKVAKVGVNGKALLVDSFENTNLALATRNNPKLTLVD